MLPHFPPAIYPRMGAQSRRRESPRFIFCDATMRVVCASREIDPEMLSEKAMRAMAPHCLQSVRSKTVLFEAYDENTVVRIVPLSGESDGCVVLFVEALGRREGAAVAKQFGLTRREAQVLPLIVRGTSNSAMAGILSIAESTIGDHVKSIMRKMKASNRIEIISKALNLEEEI
jgi:DNA-binding NarL/FixJ family response regulator